MQRVVRPELLDSLPHDHPEALRNRRELRLINALMGNHRWLERQAQLYLPAGCAAVEIGAGSGELARRLESRCGIELDGIDLCPAPADWPERRVWWRTDLSRFDRWKPYDAVFANLILHQFDDTGLATIGRRMGEHARFIFACEPARLPLHLAQFRALALLCGMGPVSRNDGSVSIRAGFRGEELPRLLRLPEDKWAWRCGANWLGRYSFAAWRKERA